MCIQILSVPPNVRLIAALLNDEQHFRLNKINESKNYFVAEIRERELVSKRLSKCVASFGYFDNSLFYLKQLVVFLLHYLQLSLEHR